MSLPSPPHTCNLVIKLNRKPEIGGLNRRRRRLRLASASDNICSLVELIKVVSGRLRFFAASVHQNLRVSATSRSRGLFGNDALLQCACEQQVDEVKRYGAKLMPLGIFGLLNSTCPSCMCACLCAAAAASPFGSLSGELAYQLADAVRAAQKSRTESTGQLISVDATF